MNSVQLPTGVRPPTTASAEGIPWGAGRPVRPDTGSPVYLAMSELAREQKASPMVGRPCVYRSPEELGHACAEYFAYVDANPWKAEKKQFSAKDGEWKATNERKKIPYTQGALCFYLGISVSTWAEYKKRDNLKHVCAWAEQRILDQKFEGAAAGFFNANIIARDLGLADKQEVSGPGGGPIEKITSDMSAEEAAERYAKTREEG